MAAPGLAVDRTEVDGLAEVVRVNPDAVSGCVVAGHREVEVIGELVAAASTDEDGFHEGVLGWHLGRVSAGIRTHLAVLVKLAVVLGCTHADDLRGCELAVLRVVGHQLGKEAGEVVPFRRSVNATGIGRLCELERRGGRSRHRGSEGDVQRHVHLAAHLERRADAHGRGERIVVRAAVHRQDDRLLDVLVAIQGRKQRKCHPHTVVVAIVQDGGIEGVATVVGRLGYGVEYGLDGHHRALQVAAEILRLPLGHAACHGQQRPAVEGAVGRIFRVRGRQSLLRRLDEALVRSEAVGIAVVARCEVDHVPDLVHSFRVGDEPVPCGLHGGGFDGEVQLPVGVARAEVVQAGEAFLVAFGVKRKTVQE